MVPPLRSLLGHKGWNKSCGTHRNTCYFFISHFWTGQIDQQDSNWSKIWGLSHNKSSESPCEFFSWVKWEWLIWQNLHCHPLRFLARFRMWETEVIFFLFLRGQWSRILIPTVEWVALSKTVDIIKLVSRLLRSYDRGGGLFSSFLMKRGRLLAELPGLIDSAQGCAWHALSGKPRLHLSPLRESGECIKMQLFGLSYKPNASISVCGTL
jgi:hypothetical protein